MPLGFELDLWDYLTFATTALAGGAGMLIYIWIALGGSFDATASATLPARADAEGPVTAPHQ